MSLWRAGCGGTRTSGSEDGPRKRTGRKAGTAPRSDPNRANVTGLVAEGVDIKTAQVLLGHSNPQLTIGPYAQAVVSLRGGGRSMAARFHLPGQPRDGCAMGAGRRRVGGRE